MQVPHVYRFSYQYEDLVKVASSATAKHSILNELLRRHDNVKANKAIDSFATPLIGAVEFHI